MIMTKARQRAREDQVLRQAYAQQLDMIGKTLIRAKLITRRDIHRDGVAFAIRNRFDSPVGHKKKIAASGKIA